MQGNNADKKELIAEMYDLAMDKRVGGRTFYYMMQAIMEMFKSQN